MTDDYPANPSIKAQTATTSGLADAVRASQESIAAGNALAEAVKAAKGSIAANVLADAAKAGQGSIVKNMLAELTKAGQGAIAQNALSKFDGALTTSPLIGAGLGQIAGDSTAMFPHITARTALGDAMKAYGQLFDSGSAWRRYAEPERARNFGLSEKFLAQIRELHYPANLRDVEGLRLKKVERVVMDDGIALYGLPRTSIVQALIDADSSGKRREILGRRWKAISTDCRSLLGQCSDPDLAPYVTVALQALDALDDGHAAAAQALTGSLIESALIDFFGERRHDFMPNKRGRQPDETFEEVSVRQLIAFAPIRQTYQAFFVDKGDRVPSSFSRHGVAHTVHPRQYTRRSAVQGLMFACSLLYRIDEEIADEPR